MRASTGRPRAVTTYYVVVSAVTLVVLGVVLVLVTASAMREQNHRVAADAAADVISYATAPISAATFESGQLVPQNQGAVDSAVVGFADRLLELRMWTADGTQVYTSAHVAAHPPDPERAAVVLSAGRSQVVQDRRWLSGSGARSVVSVYVPLRSGVFGPGRDPGDATPLIGIAEVVLDETQTLSAMSTATEQITTVVLVGLLAVWLVLLLAVHAASRQLRAVAHENARLANLDSLTGLPNRRALAERMRAAIRSTRERGGRVGLILLDLDRFKEINDTLGHDRGDELLELVAERLSTGLRDDDMVARLGGDEFAILLPDLATVQDGLRLARRVRAAFDPPFEVGGMALHVEPSIGVACLPDHATDASSLMRTADVAMYRAKTSRAGVCVYSAQTDHTSPVPLQLAGELHRALREARPGELVMHYQPKIRLDTGQTVGYEALMRWHHPQRGLVMPDAFVAVAEQSGLIHDLTRFALGSAVAQVAAWQQAGHPVPVAVNLSGHDVADDAVLAEISGLLARYHVPPALLAVEITETALVLDPSRLVPVLAQLDRLGVRVAIDDFGKGSTSISQLRVLPVHELKIDQMFVRDLSEPNRESPEVIVQAMVELAHSFGLQVVAEGVEDAVTAAQLATLGVDQAQGFYFAVPAPADELDPTWAADRCADRPVH